MFSSPSEFAKTCFFLSIDLRLLFSQDVIFHILFVLFDADQEGDKNTAESLWRDKYCEVA